MNNPYARAARSIPVTVVSNPVAGTTTHCTVIVRMEPSRHDHASGVECVACAAQTDIRAVLFSSNPRAREAARPSPV